MKKAANGRSSIYKDTDGWHGWVSFGEDATGRRRRKHVRAQTKAAVAEKVAQLERQRDAGYVADRPVTVSEWLELWTDARTTAGARPKTLEGYKTDQRHIVGRLGGVRLDKLTPAHVDQLWKSVLATGAGPAT